MLIKNTNKLVIRNSIKTVFLLTIIIVLTVIISIYLPFADDWHNTFRPATLKLVSGKSPYSVETFYNVPWSLIPLIPFALMPESIGRSLLFIISLVSFGYAAFKMGAKPSSLFLFLVSPPVMHCLYTGNLDWLAIFGIFFPPQIGILFLSIKPQIGSAIILFWLVQAWQNGKVKGLAKVLLPVTLTFLVSLVIFGLWPFEPKPELQSNSSLWPLSIPFGFVLLVAMFRYRNIKLGMVASPCLTPYLSFQSWSIALLPLVDRVPETIAGVAGLWIMVIIRLLG